MTSPNPFETCMKDEALEAYLLLCQEVFVELQREGLWPWPDSQKSENLVESEDF